MTVSTQDTLCRSGLAYPVAIEIARQMAAGTGASEPVSINKLVASGIVPQAATELARQINAGAFDSHKLAVAGFHPEAAVQIKKTSGL